MRERKEACVAALRELRERERETSSGWVVWGDLSPPHQQEADDAAGQGLVELADPRTRVELSADEGRPVLRAMRLSPAGHDVLTYRDAETAPSPAPCRHGPADDETLIELRPAEMDALRLYVRIGARLRVAPADGLAERARTAVFDRSGNRWSLFLTSAQVDSVAWALHLRSVGGLVTEANRFARVYGVVIRPDRETGVLGPRRLR